MAVTKRRMSVPADAVFAALSDGYTYAYWVVGTRDIRAVDPGFPAKDTKLHYTVGYGPLTKEDETVVLSVEPGHCLELRAHAWPAGSARITLMLYPLNGDTMVMIDERPDQGWAKKLQNPLLDISIHLRNEITLKRLERVAREKLTSSAASG